MKRFLLIGSLGFCLTSLCVFATVAFAEGWMYRNLGLIGAYLVWTVLFIGLGSAAFRPLVVGLTTPGRFALIFAIGFLLYATGWTVSYFVLRGTGGEWVGSALGSALLGLTFSIALGVRHLALRLCLVLFAANSLGYFLGAACNSVLGGKSGMLLWGVAYGLFLGAGMGLTLFYIRQDSVPDKA